MLWLVAAPLALLAARGMPRGAPPRMSAAGLPFAKYHGLGNDFVLVDGRASAEPPISPADAVAMCDRNFGVGADGVIFVLPPDSPEADSRMRIYNSDGSEPEMCGNGIRCMAKYMGTLGGEAASSYTISTLAGPIKPEMLADGGVCVDMGPPILKAEDVPTTLPANADGGAVVCAPMSVGGADWEVTCVSMGNPHAIIFVPDLDALDLPTIGPLFESHPAFPARINVEFVQVLSPTHLKMVVWERGAGPTLACGTGACALTVAAALAGKAGPKCTVTLPGGDLQIDWRRDGDGKVYMTGPAKKIYDGVWKPEQ